MNLPQIKEADRYVGLYIVDFGDHCAVGFTAEEVAELLDSETYKSVHVYKIHKACPDGRLELKGIRREQFELESGMLFYARDERAGHADFQRLSKAAEIIAPPAKAKVHFASDNKGAFVTALIYPAEYEDEFSRWLLDGQYRTEGAAEGGTAAVQRYYDTDWQILERCQLWGQRGAESLQGQALQQAARRTMVR